MGFDDDDDLHAESMLNNEADGGIDSIMGCGDGINGWLNCGSGGDAYRNPFVERLTALALTERTNEANLRRAALRRADDGDWWQSPRVSVGDIVASPKFTPLPATSPPAAEVSLKPVLGLKLNYDSVLRDWRSDAATPRSVSDPGDAAEPLAGVLVSSGGGAREASLRRYKEKRQSRLFCKKIRYQVRKNNADGRPRMKGRFVKASSCSTSTNA